MELYVYGVVYTILYVILCKMFVEIFAQKRFQKVSKNFPPVRLENRTM